jgi:hypothetical protein
VVSVAALFAENNGAGGKGLRGLPPYCDDGVPGRGLPLISGGSYETVEAGGLGQSVDTREGVDGLTGERGFAVGRGTEGALPRLELGRELYVLDAVGRYLSGEARLAEGAL